MKKIKIFLASSIDDLRNDRLEVGDFFRQLNEIYLDNGIHFSLIKCEDYDNAISTNGKQSEYDAEIRDSSLVFFLFFRKVGDYTKHEFEVALEAYKKSQKPKIITYFKYINSIDEANEEVRSFMKVLDGELKHYYNTYGNIDTLKLGIMMQIKLMKLDSTEIKVQDGEVLLNGNSIVKSKNIPILEGNKTLKELTQKKRQLQSLLSERRAAYLTDPTEENEGSFFNTSAELNRISKELTEVEKQTLELMTTVAGMTSDGRVLTYREKEALKFYNMGDYDAAQEILSDKERENELRRAENRAELSKKEIQGYVNEDLLWIKTEKARGINGENIKKIKEKYAKSVKLSEEYDLDKKVLYDYASFLQDQNDYSSSIKVAEKLQWYYSAPGASVSDEDEAMLLNLLGILYTNTQHYGDAETIILRNLELAKGLAKEKSEDYMQYVSDSYNNLGVLYEAMDRYEEAEKVHLQALEIKKHLCEKDPWGNKAGLSNSYNNLGILYSYSQRYDEAMEMFTSAVEIDEELCSRDPKSYESPLAESYNNLAILLRMVGRYSDAERVYKRVLEMRIRLCKTNPEAEEPNLATTYNNFGVLYDALEERIKAREYYQSAMEIYQKLCRRNSEAFAPDLAMTYNNLGIVCNNIGKEFLSSSSLNDSEEYYKKALELYIAEGKASEHTSELADVYNNLGVLYMDTKRYSESEKAFLSALEIKVRLADHNPEAYQPTLAQGYENLGSLYMEDNRDNEATNALTKALEIFEGLEALYRGYYKDDVKRLKSILSK